MSDAPRRLLQIDAATRVPGGLKSLIQHTPETEDWLAWIIQAVQTPTCGALEEMRDDLELHQSEWPPTADGSKGLEACPVCLLNPDEQVLSARKVAAAVWRFKITETGGYRLFTPDRMLLWEEYLAAGRDNPGNPDQSGVWHLAAASKPIGPLVRRWMIPKWMLVVECLQTAAGYWLDVIDQEELA